MPGDFIRLARGHPYDAGRCTPEDRRSGQRTAQSLIYFNNSPTLEVTQPKSRAVLCPTTAEIVRRIDPGVVSDSHDHQIKALTTNELTHQHIISATGAHFCS